MASKSNNVNRRNASAYANKIRQWGRAFNRDFIVPFIREVVKTLAVEAAYLTPINMGVLRGSWMITVNGSGRLPASPDFVDIAKMVDMNMKSFTLGKELAIENDVPYAELYEYGGFEPANPQYREIGGSLALHVPISRRSEKRGKVLIVDGYNVTAPQGMVAGAIDLANFTAANGKNFSQKVVIL